jgi:hypothetical protein
MHALDSDERDDSDIVFRDLIMLMLSGFVTLAVLMLAHVNAPNAKTADGAEPPGNVIVEARWPDELDTDVDLWVQAPGDVPVGYSNKGGKIFNLLRDDLGRRADATGMNYEISYSRGLIAGEYTVNVHLYRNAAGGSVPVKVVVSTKRGVQDPVRQVVASQVQLVREGQEITVYRFRLDDQGRLEPGSVNNLAKALRSGAKS